MLCKNCGYESRKDAIFCTNCGTRFDDAPMPVVAVPPEVPTPPSTSIIPDPPKIPEMPAPPNIVSPQQEPPEDAPSQQETPEDALPQQDEPPQYPPPPPLEYMPYQPTPPEYAPYQPTPPAYPPYQPMPPEYAPYQQTPPPYAPLPQYPPQSDKKQSNTAIIITIVCVAVLVIGAIIALFAFDFSTLFGDDVQWPEPVIIVTPAPVQPPPPAVTPAPAQTPAPPSLTPAPPSLPGDELLGNWEFDSGAWLWFFGESDYIMFLDFGGGDRVVFASEGDQLGDWYIDAAGSLFVEADYGMTYVFTYRIVGDRLTIIDDVYDQSIYIKTD